MDHDRARALIARQFADGPLPPLEDQALRAHVRRCDSCRAYYDRVGDLETGMGGDAAVIARLQARGAPAVVTAAPRRRWIAPLALAAGVLLAVGVWWARTPEPEWGVKGGGAAVDARITLFHQTADKQVKRVDGVIAARDGLLVSYTNPKDGAGYLAVVARSASGDLHWLAPVWTDPGAAPKSQPIDRGVADHEIPRVVHHDFASGTLEVCGIFSAAPHAIPDLDRKLSANWPPAPADCHRLEVTR